MKVVLSYFRRAGDKPAAEVVVEVRLTPKRVFAERQAGPIHYLTKVGTKRSLTLSLPKMFDRDTGRRSVPKKLEKFKDVGWHVKDSYLHLLRENQS